MPIIKQVNRTYKYRMYRNDKSDKHLFNQIDIAGIIWNHCLALQRRYHDLTDKYISRYKLQKHIAKLAKNRKGYELLAQCWLTGSTGNC